MPSVNPSTPVAIAYPADPAFAPDPRSDAERERKEPKDDRRDRTPDLNRWQRDESGRDPER